MSEYKEHKTLKDESDTLNEGSRGKERIYDGSPMWTEPYEWSGAEGEVCVVCQEQFEPGDEAINAWRDGDTALVMHSSSNKECKRPGSRGKS